LTRSLPAPAPAARPRLRVSTRTLRQGRRCWRLPPRWRPERCGPAPAGGPIPRPPPGPLLVAMPAPRAGPAPEDLPGGAGGASPCGGPEQTRRRHCGPGPPANGARASSSSRGLAWRSRAKVSCTRSSTTCGSLTRAATTRRISGVSARRSCCCWVSEVGRSSPVPQASWADREWATGHGAVA